MTSTQWFQLSIVILPIILPPLIRYSLYFDRGDCLRDESDQKRFCYHHSTFAAR